MKIYTIGIFNGYDVDDYYINANSRTEAIRIAEEISGGSYYC